MEALFRARWEQLRTSPWALGSFCLVAGAVWLLGSLMSDKNLKSPVPAATFHSTPLKIVGRLSGGAFAEVSLRVHFPSYPLDVFFSSTQAHVQEDGQFYMEFPAFLSSKEKAVPLWIIARCPDGRKAQRQDLTAQGEPLSCDAGILTLQKPAGPRPENRASSKPLSVGEQGARDEAQSPAVQGVK